LIFKIGKIGNLFATLGNVANIGNLGEMKIGARSVLGAIFCEHRIAAVSLPLPVIDTCG
jgi:molybdopterin synthase catalytic subunit